MQLKFTNILSIFKILNIDHQSLDIELSSLCMQKMLLQLFFINLLRYFMKAEEVPKHWVGLFLFWLRGRTTL